MRIANSSMNITLLFYIDPNDWQNMEQAWKVYEGIDVAFIRGQPASAHFTIGSIPEMGDLLDASGNSKQVLKVAVWEFTS